MELQGSGRWGWLGLCAFLLGLAGPARAQLQALVVIEPTERRDGLMVSRAGLEAGLSKATGLVVKVGISEDLTDAMRTSRSAGPDLFIAPPQVVASALNHGYELVGSTDTEDQFLLVGKSQLPGVAALKAKGRVYLPQQDSIYTYMARGMLNADGLSFRDMQQVQYARFPMAGLTAITMNLAEATVVRKLDWDAWSQRNPGAAKVLASSDPVPGGLSVAVRSKLPTEVKVRLTRYFENAIHVTSAGLRPVAVRGNALPYKRIAELGTFTPSSLPGAVVVDAPTVRKLQGQGAVLVDTRTEAEYKQARIEGAVWVPYVERSLKDVAYDASMDEFKGLANLDRNKPTVFLCNGAECWKSYKASRAALAQGFKQVYWFRGGMPEWQGFF